MQIFLFFIINVYYYYCIFYYYQNILSDFIFYVNSASPHGKVKQDIIWTANKQCVLNKIANKRFRGIKTA